MRTRYSLSGGVGGIRGGGLGNEVLAYGKSFLAAESLGLQLLRPLWLMNAYGLGQQFGYSRISMVRSLGARLSRSMVVTEDMYRSSGCRDYGLAMASLARSGLFDQSRTLIHEGMWGGYSAIENSIPFLKGEFLSAPGVTSFLGSLKRPSGALTVAVHIRMGDFARDIEVGPGDFNRALPIGWYLNVMRILRTSLSCPIQFIVASDAPPGQLSELDNPDVVFLRGAGPSAPIQEFMALTDADLLVCSISSFSMLAAFMSDRPYIWHRQQLTESGEGLKIWGDGARDGHASNSDDQLGARTLSSGLGRGTALTGAEDHLPTALTECLEILGQLRSKERDLLYFGSVRDFS